MCFRFSQSSFLGKCLVVCKKKKTYNSPERAKRESIHISETNQNWKRKREKKEKEQSCRLVATLSLSLFSPRPLLQPHKISYSETRAVARAVARNAVHSFMNSRIALHS